MRICLLLSLSFLMSMSSFAQSKNNFWQLTTETPQMQNEERIVVPAAYQLFELQLDALATQLKAAPAEWSSAARNRELTIGIPLPNGAIENFAIWESSVMSPVLAAKFPEIKTYKGQGIEDATKIVRFTVGPSGFQGGIKTLDGRIQVSPYMKDNKTTYVSFYTKDANHGVQHECGYNESNLPQIATENTTPVGGSTPQIPSEGVKVDLLVYRVALACTAEFAEIFGGTVSGAMEAMATGLGQLNLLYENENAIRFQLIDNNDQLIYTDPNDQHFTNTSNGFLLLGQNNALLTQDIGSANYDVGHVFTGTCGGGLGGVAAGGSTCGPDKARGVTCNFSSNIIGTVTEIMAHEIGHQFSAGHTWNHCPGIDGQYAPGSAFEPGSGSTILSYSGSCGSANNVQNNSDDYFNIGSLQQIYSFSRNGNGSNCPTTIATNNNTPDLTVPEGGFHIPISTPFELIAEATDENNDPITYCWEQYNTGPYTPLGEPVGNGPSFRSYPPRIEANRVFPRIQNLVNNITNIREVLPTYSRNLKFRCTVRDMNPEVGGVVWDEISFEATEQAGPFVVTYPNQTTILEVGSTQTVTWEVANTDQSPVNCQNVNILLSLDGGLTYPIVLESNVPNDGAQDILIPNQETATARIRVQAANNIFFDISNNDFEIVGALTPGYSLQVSPSDILACPPEVIEIDLISGSLLGFTNSITYQVSGLPAGATASFTNNNVTPGETSKLVLDMTDVTEFGEQSITLEATADGTDLVMRTIDLNIVNNDFSSVVLETPVNGTDGMGQLPSFSWTASPNADFYVVQVSTTAGFGNIVETGVVNDGTTFFPSSQLESGTVYYWRVLPGNICGEGAGTDAFAFKTATLSCETYETEDVVMNISAIGLPEIFSTLNVPTSGIISDLNVTFLEGEHDIVRHIDVKLISPAGTEVTLFSDLLCGTTVFNLGIDDDAPLEIPCPPVGTSFLPKDEAGLAKFNGENSEGDWKIRVKVINELGSGGELNDFGLEICAGAAVVGPELINNNALLVPPGGANWIKTAELLAEDDVSGPEDLVYTIVNTPDHGVLRRGGTLLWAGKTFTQKAIDDLAMVYEHGGADNDTDSFTFTVSDPDGGWLGTPTFNIEIDENVIVSLDDTPGANQVFVYPNPTDDLLNVRFQQATDTKVSAVLYNIHGQKLMESTFNRIEANEAIELNTANLANGLYLLRIEQGGHTVVKKVTVQK